MGDGKRDGGPTSDGDGGRLEGDWSDAADSARKSWGDRPDEPPAGGDEEHERTREGYGTGKDDADPQTGDGGTAPGPPIH